MKRKELEIRLQKVPRIIEPRADLEQYSTPARLAADILFSAFMNGDIEGKRIADLGTGSGIFAIGASLLGAKTITAIDCDERMIAQARSNAEMMGAGNISYISAEIRGDGLRHEKNTKTSAGIGGKGTRTGATGAASAGIGGKGTRTGAAGAASADIDNGAAISADTVLMNPPFGSQRPHADIPFLEFAIGLAPVVYSIHRTGTLEYLRCKIEEFGGNIEEEQDFNFPIPYTFAFHDKEVLHFDVTVLRIVRVNKTSQGQGPAGCSGNGPPPLPRL